MANKPTTLGYFMKRLHDSGYNVEKLYTDYSEIDSRAWTVVIDPRNASIMCTCFVNRSNIGDNYFEFYDGGQFLPSYKLKTQSIEVLLEHLNKYNIFNKNKDYTEKGFKPVVEDVVEKAVS